MESNIALHSSKRALLPSVMIGCRLLVMMLPVQLWVLGSHQHLLLASIHHCITDGWSVALLQRELQAATVALMTGSAPSWAPLPVQFVDYAAWQRQHITRDLLQAHLTWWQENLRGAPPLLELPWDHQRPEIAGYAGAAMPVQVPPAVTAQLQQLAAAEHTTLFCVVLAAVQVRSCR